MRFGIFYEHQLPKPWAENDEERLFAEALDQVALADRLGYDNVWAVEHHFLEEYSHSSAPEVFLAAAAARTENIRAAATEGRGAASGQGSSQGTCSTSAVSAERAALATPSSASCPRQSWSSRAHRSTSCAVAS